MTAVRYAVVLAQLGFEENDIQRAADIFGQCRELICMLQNPVIEKAAKHRIIDRIFSGKMRNFVKLVNDYGKIESICDIFRAYEEQKDRADGVVTARLEYVVPPDDRQRLSMEEFICREFHAEHVRWEPEERPELIGGFLLSVEGREYDYSTKGRLERLQQKLTWR